jgi:outer membrane protein OmpA-like peptidoglycan-associated protein
MRTSRHPKTSLLGLWLVISILQPALGFAGAAETLSQPTPKDLVSPPVDLQVPRAMDVRGPPPMNLQFQTMDLQFRVEDVKGAVQALAMKETKTEVKIELSGDVLFEFDKADIRPEAEPALQRVVEIIQQYPRAGISIDGYTDAKGADAYNLRLSDRRAAAVKSWLVQKGSVNGKQIKTKGWGKANPVAPNTNPDGSDNPDGRQKNRRVEITVKK